MPRTPGSTSIGPRGWRSVAGPAAFALASIALLVFDHLQQRVAADPLLADPGADRLRLRLDDPDQPPPDRGARGTHPQLAQRPGHRPRQPAPAGDRHPRRRCQTPATAASCSSSTSTGCRPTTTASATRPATSWCGASPTRWSSRRRRSGGNAYRIDDSRLALLVPAADRQIGEIVLAATAAPARRGPGPADRPRLRRGRDPRRGIRPRDRDADRRPAPRRPQPAPAPLRPAPGPRGADGRARRPPPRAPRTPQGRRLPGDLPRPPARPRAARRSTTSPSPPSSRTSACSPCPRRCSKKRAALTEEEIELIRNRPIAGEQIIGAAPGLAPVASLVRASAEHFDGSGFPDGIAGEAIPLGSRIIAVAVAYAALTAPRPYRAAGSPEDALAELHRCAGTQFDPRRRRGARRRPQRRAGADRRRPRGRLGRSARARTFPLLRCPSWLLPCPFRCLSWASSLAFSRPTSSWLFGFFLSSLLLRPFFASSRPFSTPFSASFRPLFDAFLDSTVLVVVLLLPQPVQATPARPTASTPRPSATSASRCFRFNSPSDTSTPSVRESQLDDAIFSPPAASC